MIAKGLILLFNLIRPLLGNYGCCPFRITCMTYAKHQLNGLPVCKALYNIGIRLLKCSPLSFFIDINFLES